MPPVLFNTARTQRYEIDTILVKAREKVLTIRDGYGSSMDNFNTQIDTAIKNQKSGDITFDKMIEILNYILGQIERICIFAERDLVILKRYIIDVEIPIYEYSSNPYAKDIKSLQAQLNALRNGHVALSNWITSYKNNLFGKISKSKVSTHQTNPIDEIKLEERIIFPPVHIFPRNPSLIHWIDPEDKIDTYSESSESVKSRVGKSLSSRKNSLEFSIGIKGTRNIIKTTSPIYIDYTQYNFNKNIWYQRPIILSIDGNDITTGKNTDITDYKKNSLVNISREATSIYDDLSFYFDGEKIITNFDFSNPADRERISIKYKRLADNIKVKATMINLSPSQVFKTPTIDQYTLVVGSQKVN